LILQKLRQNKHIGVNESEIIQVPNVTEMSQGGAEGVMREQVYTKEKVRKLESDLWNFKHNGLSHTDGSAGESLRDVEFRVKKFIENNILVKNSKLNIVTDKIPVIAIFMHGIAIKCFLRSIQGSYVNEVPKNKIDNTSITEVFYDASKESDLQGWIINRVNDCGHIIS